MSETQIKVPNIGDFKDVEVIEVLVSEGQTLKKNDPLITIESDKSSVEIPSPEQGTIKFLNIKVGDKVSEGDIILILESGSEAKKEIKEKPKSMKVAKEEETKKIENAQSKINRINVNSVASASPKVRKFARELGVDINKILGSESGGRIVEEDIKNFVSLNINKKVNHEGHLKKKVQSEFEHSDFGEIEIKDISRVKKLASAYLINSWTTIPHVTNHDEVDITEMENFRTSLTDIYTGEKMKITPLAFLIKALVASLKKFPSFNSSIDDIENGKMTLKKYFHIGIAVDTPNGLMVPKMRNANDKKISIFSRELK